VVVEVVRWQVVGPWLMMATGRRGDQPVSIVQARVIVSPFHAVGGETPQHVWASFGIEDVVVNHFACRIVRPAGLHVAVIDAVEIARMMLGGAKSIS
jgi:hypothetical protein